MLEAAGVELLLCGESSTEASEFGYEEDAARQSSPIVLPMLPQQAETPRRSCRFPANISILLHMILVSVLRVAIRLVTYKLAVRGPYANGGGVLPDLAVTRHIGDQLRGMEVVLKNALRLVPRELARGPASPQSLAASATRAPTLTKCD
jgi:hypothetical protein